MRLTAPERGLSAVRIKSFHTTECLFFFLDKASFFSQNKQHTHNKEPNTHACTHTRARTDITHAQKHEPTQPRTRMLHYATHTCLLFQNECLQTAGKQWK